MGLKGYMLWVMGQLDSTCRAPPRAAAPLGLGGLGRVLAFLGCLTLAERGDVLQRQRRPNGGAPNLAQV
jgi:hypothetical protein